jgi:hypothetical protein
MPLLRKEKGSEDRTPGVESIFGGGNRVSQRKRRKQRGDS